MRLVRVVRLLGDRHEVRHFWSCENCGHEIEMRVNPRINAASTRLPDQRAQIRGDLRPASGRAGFPTPVPTEAGPMPTDTAWLVFANRTKPLETGLRG